MESASQTNSVLSSEMMGRLERMELVSRKIFRGRMKGERRSKRKGQSVEFADFRNYVPGDDLRFIDWNLYARLDRLYLKLFLEEEDLHFYAIVDDSLSMSFGAPSKFFAAKQIAACLSYIGLCRGDRVSVSTFSSAGAPLVLRGKSSAQRLVGMLDSVEVSSEAPEMSEAVRRFCLRNSGKGIVVLISDLMGKGGYESAMRMLVARQMDVVLVHMLSPEELSPSFQGDLKLVDCEDGEVREISVSMPVMERYHQTLSTFLENAKNFCNRMSIAYVPTRSDEGADHLVNESMRTRGLVR